MKLVWTQSQLAWIATHPDALEKRRGDPLTREVPPEVERLSEHLLSIRGALVCVPFSENQITAILARGEVASGDGVQRFLGRQSECHGNSARLWRRSFGRLRIITGYALSGDDQMWRQHSWVVDQQGRVGETTETRIMYFGIRLTFLESVRFALVNT